MKKYVAIIFVTNLLLGLNGGRLFANSEELKVLEQLQVYRDGQLQKGMDLNISDYLQLKPIITTAGKGMLQDIEYNSNYKQKYQYMELSE